MVSCWPAVFIFTLFGNLRVYFAIVNFNLFCVFRMKVDATFQFADF